MNEKMPSVNQILSNMNAEIADIIKLYKSKIDSVCEKKDDKVVSKVSDEKDENFAFSYDNIITLTNVNARGSYKPVTHTLSTVTDEINRIVELYKSKIILKVNEKSTINDIKNAITSAAKSGKNYINYEIIKIDPVDYFFQNFNIHYINTNEHVQKLFAGNHKNEMQWFVIEFFKSSCGLGLVMRKDEFFKYGENVMLQEGNGPTSRLCHFIVWRTITVFRLLCKDAWLNKLFESILPGFKFEFSGSKYSTTISTIITWNK